jgi:hypothetical protein
MEKMQSEVDLEDLNAKYLQASNKLEALEAEMMSKVTTLEAELRDERQKRQLSRSSNRDIIENSRRSTPTKV